MAGWNKRSGNITECHPSEDKVWSLFNYVFSNSSRKRNTYKFGLIKALLDSAFDGINKSEGLYYSYEDLFAKFAENYWNLVAKYDLRQMRRDGKSEFSRIETIIKDFLMTNPICTSLEFDALGEVEKTQLIRRVASECKKCVVGALYEDFDGIIYSFDLKDDGLYLNYAVYEFMLKYKYELERLNYYSWARFLEQVNDDNALIRVIEKLELATPRRGDLSVYREILRYEFEENTCFYCGKKLIKKCHVDHFIPWSFIKDDKIWNFVLACPACNEKKSNRIPAKDYLIKIESRNDTFRSSTNEVVKLEFNGYDNKILERIWDYAKKSGFKEIF